MKQKLLNSIKLRVAMLVAVMCAVFTGQAWADTYTIGWGKASGSTGTYSNFTANSGTVTSLFSFSCDKNSGTNDPVYNASDEGLRLYSTARNGNRQGCSITITPAAGVTITGVTVNATSSYTPDVNYFVDGGSATSASLDGTTYSITGISATSSIKLQNAYYSTSGTKQWRFTTIQITYSAGTAAPTFLPTAGAVEKGTSVTISSSTSGSTIYYTTDGSTTPTTSVYDGKGTDGAASASVTINAAQTIKAIAVKGGNSSTVASAAYTIKKVATPTFDPAEGSVVYGAGIALSCETDGATIHYTTDGSTPTSSSPTYSSAISVAGSTTIKAIAIKDNWDDSDVASADYTIKAPDTPVFGTTSGTSVYYGSKVTLSAEAGTSIYYTMTTNGDTPADPTNTSTAYPDGGIAINNNTVKIKAIAYDAGGNASTVSSADYTLKNPEPPTFTPAAGAVAEGSALTLSAAEETTIHYTTNGDDPTSESATYDSESKPVINAAQTIKAIAIDGAGNSSTTASAAYTTFKANISLSAAQTLTFNDFSGIGSYSNPKSADFPASDKNSYRMTGAQFGYYSSSLQMQKNTSSLTSGTISTPNGFTLSITAATQPTVKFGSVVTAASSSADGTSHYSCASTSTTFTLEATATVNITAITITANKGVNTITATTARSIDRTNSESSITLDATSSSGSVTYAVKSSTIDNEDYSFNTSTGVLTVTGTYSGTIVITASSAATSSYFAAEDVDITVSVIGSKTDPTIAVSDDNVTYGENYVLDTSGFASGTVSLESGNTSIATVEGLTITPVAVGTVSITVNTASSVMYNAGSATFDLTVDAPAGKTAAVKGVTTSTATLDFTDNTEWEFPSNTEKGVDADDFDDGTYTITLTGTSGNGYGFNSTDKYLILGKSGATLTFQAFDKFVTQIDVTGRSGASGSVTQNIYVGSKAVSEESTGATGKNEYEIDEAYQAPGNIYTLKVTNANNTQITQIKIYFTDVATASVTLNPNGYATYCSVNPIDFSSTSGYTAWRVSDITSAGVITFNKITERIKGGQGVLLYNKNADGENTSNATIIFGAGSRVFTSSENKLVGTIAPTNVEAGTVYGLSGDKFVKNNAAGNVPAGKAFIDAESIPAEVKAFTFVFEDETTGITETRQATREEVEAIFNLGGQRLQKMQRGINIVNGKKILVK